MKKRPEQTKEQRERDLRFIRRGSPRVRKYKKLINGRMTKEDLVLLISALWKGFGSIKVKRQGVTKRRYKNIPPTGRLNGYSRKILTGIYGSHLELAKKEGLV